MKCKDCQNIIQSHYDHYLKQLETIEKELNENKSISRYDKKVLLSTRDTLNGHLMALYELLKIK